MIEAMEGDADGSGVACGSVLVCRGVGEAVDEDLAQAQRLDGGRAGRVVMQRAVRVLRDGCAGRASGLARRLETDSAFD
jgi:hypothetical protein